MQCLLNRSFCFSCPGAEGTDRVSVYFWSEYCVAYQHTINYTTDVLSHWNQFAGVMSSSVSTIIFSSLKFTEFKFAVSSKWCTFLILPCFSRLEYFDEAVRDPASQTAVPVDIHQPPAFLHKILQLSAVQLFYDSNGIVQVMEPTSSDFCIFSILFSLFLLPFDFFAKLFLVFIWNTSNQTNKCGELWRHVADITQTWSADV